MIDINTITAESMRTNEALIRDYMKTNYPSLDTAPGTAIDETVVKPAASLYAAQDAKLTDLLSQFSLSLLAANPNASMTLAQELSSNYRVLPRTGTPGTGTLAVYTTSTSNTYIYRGTKFSSSTLVMTTSKTYVGIIADTIPASTETVEYRKAVLFDDGIYVFTIPVSTTINTSATVSEGQAVTMDNKPATVTQVVVSGTISGGTDAETAQSLATRALYGVTASVPSGNAHISALFSEVQDVNVYSQKSFGLGDAEMLRDRNNISNVSMGGKVDVYCRTASLPSSSQFTVTATKVSGDTWQASIDRSMAPGFYYISSLTRSGSQIVLSGTDISTTFGASQAVDGPSVSDGISARYSSYQTAMISFTFPGLSTTTDTFQVIAVTMPGVETLQSYINSRDIRNDAQDVLVKAPVPNYIGLNMTCTVPPGVNAITEDQIRTVVVSAINSTEIGRKFISAADVVTAIQAVYPTIVVGFPMIMTNTVYLPDGKTQTVSTDKGQVNASEKLEEGITYRNAAFMCQGSDISVTFQERETVL
jgi:hypothetical protein